MRPRFSDLELTFLLELLRETETRKNRQVLSLQEEQHHIQMSVDSLHHRLLFDPYTIHRKLKTERERLELLDREWLPVCNKQAVILRGLIVRLEKILAHKRGRIPYSSYMVETYLKQICTKDVPKVPKLLA